MLKEIKDHFDFSLNTINIAFILFLKFFKKKEWKSMHIATAALLIAAKYQEPLHNIPFLDELIEKYTEPSSCIEEEIKMIEISILLELDWNLKFITIIEACYHILKNKADYVKCQNHIETDILKNLIYPLPTFNNSDDKIFSRENSMKNLFMSENSHNSKGQLLKRKRVKKQHSGSCWKIEQDLKAKFEIDTNKHLLNVPQKTSRKKKKSRKRQNPCRIAKISEGLSDILRIYEASDSENTQSNTS